MPTNLSNGYKKPNTGENGTVFGPVLEDNWERISTHGHDGVDSDVLPSSSISKNTASAPSGSWAVDGSRYKQNVTIPTGYSYDTSNVTVMDTSTKERIWAGVEKVDANTLTVYTNDNTLNYTLLFS